MQELINKIKSYKKYKTISDELIIRELDEYLKKHPEFLEDKLSKHSERELVKEIRKKLHRIYSSYQTKKKKNRVNLLKELKIIIKQKPINKKAIEIINNQLLFMTLSTKERLPYYLYIYKEIFKITGKPKTIVDLGSGLNPISFSFMKVSSLKYYTYDIDIADRDFINNYFKTLKPLGLYGKAEIKNIKTLKVDVLPKSDLVFMFKVIDLIDEKKKKISKKLIYDLLEKKKTKFVVASFSTKTLTRKPMKLQRRIGFEKMLKQLNLKYKDFSIGNEIFYIISK